MKINHKLVSVFLCVLVLVSAFTTIVSATESKQITQEKTFEVNTKEYACEFEPTIEKDGRKYKLDSQSIQGEIVSEKPVTEPETVQETRDYEHLTQQTVEQEITVDREGVSVALQLSDVQYTPTVFDSGASTRLNSSTDLGYSLSVPDAPQTKEIKYTQNGVTSKATVSLVDVVQQHDFIWKDGYTITGRYYGDADSLYYQFGDAQIDNVQDGTVPYKGHENAILQTLRLSGDTCRINSAEWAGIPTIDNGVTVRNAVVYCSRYVARYIANYTGTAPEQINGYNAKAVYSAEIDKPTGEVIYTVQATASYIKVDSPILTILKVGIALIVIFVVGLLFILKRRRHKRGQE